MKSDTTIPFDWTSERKGSALDLYDHAQRRVAWLTSEGRVYVDRACTPSELRIIAAWAEAGQ